MCSLAKECAMKKLLLGCLMISTFSLFAQEHEVQLASDIWPPFTNVEKEHAFALDLVKMALNRSAVHVDTEILEFDDVLDGIKERKYDGSAALWYTDERASFLVYSDPYLQNRLILVGKKGSDVSARSFAELTGKRVALVGNYAYGLSDADLKDVELIQGRNDQENLERLLNGETDYLLADALLIEYLLTYQEKEATQYLSFGAIPLIIKDLHFTLHKDVPNAEEIINRFNIEVIRMIADGSYNRILQLNWIQADINGDGTTELVLNGTKAGAVAPNSSYSVLFNGESAPNNSKSGGYYIDGKYYESWNEVPGKYKVAPTKGEDLGDIGALSFRF